LSAPGCMGLDTAELKAALLNNVDPVASLAGKTLTGGRLNVAKAIAGCKAQAPSDFAISATPSSASVKQGRTATYTVTVSGIGTFSGKVGLTVNCPTAATCTFNRNPVSTPGNSTLTVATRSTTPLGTYLLVINGNSGSLNRSTPVVLTVKR